MKAKIYITYQLQNENVGSYYDAAHCNYINEVEFDTTTLKEINFYFNDVNDFKFLTTGLTNTTGFTATKINLLVQKVIDGGSLLSDGWKIYDATPQITGHISGNTLTAVELVNTVFRINLADYDSKPIYNLGYLNYPPKIDETQQNYEELKKLPEYLSFGDEEYFIGNVDSDIEAKIFAMNINIPTSEFNYSTNLTWNEQSDVYISEVGIYNDSNVLVGIGKLKTPIIAGGSNVIVFGIDF